MRKLLIAIIIALFLIPAAHAAKQCAIASDCGRVLKSGECGMTWECIDGTCQALSAACPLEDESNSSAVTPAKTRTAAEIKEKIQEKNGEIEQETENKSRTEQKVWKNQNTVREAVHALLLMKDELGGIGQQVSAIAKDFDNSVNKTAKLEEKIQKKSRIAKFFTGGDKETAIELEGEVKANKERVQQLKQLKDSCNCSSDEIKTMYGEQIQLMEQEQTRLGELAEKEKSSRGIFGWLKK